MNILIATGLYPPEIGGPATYTEILEEELPKLGHTPVIVPFGLVRGLPKIIRHIVYFFLVAKRGFRSDVIYALDPVSVGLPALLVAKLMRKRFLVRIAGDYAWEQGTARYGVKDSLDTFSKKMKEYKVVVQLLKKVEFFVARYAERVIVPSKYLKKIVSNWGIDGSHISVIYNSLDRKSTRLNSSHSQQSRMPSSA